MKICSLDSFSFSVWRRNLMKTALWKKEEWSSSSTCNRWVNLYYCELIHSPTANRIAVRIGSNSSGRRSECWKSSSDGEVDGMKIGTNSILYLYYEFIDWRILILCKFIFLSSATPETSQQTWIFHRVRAPVELHAPLNPKLCRSRYFLEIGFKVFIMPRKSYFATRRDVEFPKRGIIGQLPSEGQ